MTASAVCNFRQTIIFHDSGGDEVALDGDHRPEAVVLVVARSPPPSCPLVQLASTC
jgi:hypothetical protein